MKNTFLENSPRPLINFNGFACSFNSLTQCMHSLELFREKILNYPKLEIPFIFKENYVNSNKMEQKRQYYLECLHFIEEYKKIYSQWNSFDFSKNEQFSMENCVNHFYSSDMRKILSAANDPHTEYLSLLHCLSVPFSLPYFSDTANFSLSNSIKSLFEFVYLRSEDQSIKNDLYINIDRSSIYNIDIQNNFFNFRENQKSTSNDKRLNEIIKLPPILVMHFNNTILENKTQNIQMELDFKDFYIGESPTKYQLTSFIGLTPGGIHAVAFIRKTNLSDSSWYFCSDGIIKEITTKQLYSPDCLPTYFVELAFYTQVK